MHVLREAIFLVHHQGKRFPSLHLFITFEDKKYLYSVLYVSIFHTAQVSIYHASPQQPFSPEEQGAHATKLWDSVSSPAQEKRG